MSNLIETIKEFTGLKVVAGRDYVNFKHIPDEFNPNLGYQKEYINIDNVEIPTRPNFIRAARLDAPNEDPSDWTQKTLFAADLDNPSSLFDAFEICDHLQTFLHASRARIFKSSEGKHHLVTNLILTKKDCFEQLEKFSAAGLIDSKWLFNCKQENCLFLRTNTVLRFDLMMK